MEIFINELSLHGQYREITDFELAAKQFIGLFIWIEGKIKNKELYKDALFIQREALLQTPFSASFENIRNKELKNAFRNIVFNRLNPINWREYQKHNPEDWFICDICTENDGLVSDTSLAEAVERQLIDEAKQVLIINFSSSIFSNKIVKIVKNESMEVTLTHFDNEVSIQKWYEKFPISNTLFLQDKVRFKKSSLPPQQGAIVYEELETGYFWYLDNLHRDEFEVFDTQGNHIGTTDLQGNENPNSQKKGRTIKI